MECFPIIVSSPSGGGKTTIVDLLLKMDDTLAQVITATTRAPRTGEINGKDYFFWTYEQFQTAVKQKKMAEWAKVHVNYYGIPKSSFDDVMRAGKYPLLVIDVQGGKTVKKKYPQSVSIFITPPNIEVLRQRIEARNDGTKNIDLRLDTAKKEIAASKNYDYTVINDSLETAVNETAAVIAAAKKKFRAAICQRMDTENIKDIN